MYTTQLYAHLDVFMRICLGKNGFNVVFLEQKMCNCDQNKTDT